MKRSNQSGVAHIMILSALVLVAVIGFAGWRVVSTNKSSSNVSQSASPKVEAKAEKLENVSDVQKASAELDTSDVDKSLDASQLDADMNDLL